MAFRLDYVRSRLPGREVHHYDTIDSTMHEAEALALAGAASGAAVVADEQSAGLGRHGHSWHSERNAGLYCSVVIRRALPPDSLPLLTLALGLAAAEAVDRVSGAACDIRWPNDLMIGDRKTGGILVQLVSQPGARQTAVAGIGINIAHTEFPPDLEDLATSLLLETGRAPSREELLIELLPAADRWCDLLADRGRAAIIGQFSRRSTYALGRRVFAGDLIGTTAGLTDGGFLLIDTDDGRRETILAGGVRAAGIGRG